MVLFAGIRNECIYLVQPTFAIPEALSICSILMLKGITNLIFYSAFGLFNGLHCGNMHCLNGLDSFKQPSAKVGFSIKDNVNIKSAFSGEGNLFHNSNVASNALISDVSGGVEVQSDSIVLGALSADMAPITSGFPVENDEFDLDLPSEGFSSIPEAIEDIYKGKVGLHVDVVISIKAKTFT